MLTHTNVKTKLAKEVTCFDIKNKKYKMMIEISFTEYNPLQFAYSILDQWIKSTINQKTIFPEEAASMVYEKMMQMTKEEGHDCPFIVSIYTVKNRENFNVSVTLEHEKGKNY